MSNPQPAIHPHPHAQNVASVLLLWRKFRPYRWSIFGTALVGVLAGYYYSQTQPRIYRATATILIEPRNNRAVQLQEVYDPGIGTTEYFNTQFEILGSRALAAKLVERLNLTGRPEFAPQPSRSLLSTLGQYLPFLPAAAPPPIAESSAAAAERITDVVGGSSSVEPIVRTQLVRVHMDSTSPALAKDMANALSEVYIESTLESRMEATRKASQWLTDKLAEIRQLLEQSESRLQNYREQEKLVVVGGDRGLLDAAILDSSQRLRDTQKVRVELESTYNRIREAGDDPVKLDLIRNLLGSPSVGQTREAYLNAQAQAKQIEERYGQKHPQMVDASARLEQAQRAYYEQLRNAAQGLKAQYEVALKTERQFSGNVAGATDRIRQLDRKQYAAGVLERDVTSNRELYDLFLKRFKEIDTESNYAPVSARVVETARLPAQPYKPNATRIMQIWGLLGALLGMLLSWLHLNLKVGARSSGDLQQITGLNTLAAVPYVRGRSERRNLVETLLQKPNSQFSEAIRSLRTATQLSELDAHTRCILVTSAVAGEGKSTIAAALALSLTAHERVLLVDGDLRKSSLRECFAIPGKQPGLHELLIGSASLEDCLYHEARSGLTVLSASQSPGNAGEIVGSAAMQTLIKDLAGRYDRIIIDAPPVLAVGDALALARYADGILFVAKADSSAASVIHEALRQLASVRTRILGTVLNQADYEQQYGYENQYQYGYR